MKKKVTHSILYVTMLVVLVMSIMWGVGCTTSTPTSTAKPTATSTPESTPTSTPASTAKPIVTSAPTSSPTSTAASTTTFQWRFDDALHSLTSFPGSITGKDWVDKVAELTGGRLKITYYPGGSLGFSPTETHNLIRDRVVDMGNFNPGYFGYTGIPAVSVVDMTFLYDNPSELRRILDYVYGTYGKQFEQKFNLKILMYFSYGQRHIYAKKPITSIKDIEGLKIRAGQTAEVASDIAMGMVPTKINVGEIYQGVQRGIVDAMEVVHQYFLQAKLYEALPYINITNERNTHSIIAVNRDAFNALPPDVQQILLDTAREYQEKIWSQIEVVDRDALAQLLKAGAILNEVPPDVLMEMKKRVKPAWENVAKDLGPDAQNTLKVVRAWLGK